LKYLETDHITYDLNLNYVSDLSLAYQIPVYMENGRLNLGCHTFSRANSKKIIRWLGITPTRFVMARKIGRKVRNA